MFVGDSLGRNQWESLICLIFSSSPQTPTQMTRGEPLSTFRFLVSCNFKPSDFVLKQCLNSQISGGFLTLQDQNSECDKLNFLQEYELTVSYYKAPYLVDIEIENGKRVLKLEEISMNGNAWVGADVISFNTGHWWSHTGSLQGFVMKLEILMKNMINLG